MEFRDTVEIVSYYDPSSRGQNSDLAEFIVNKTKSVVPSPEEQSIVH